MAAYTPGADTNTEFKVSKTTTKSVISTFMISGTNYRIFGTTTTTVVELRGLTRNEALNIAESADYNYNAKHGVTFYSSASGPTAWMRADMCEGAECRADAKRINEADMWRVTVTYSNTVASHSSWTVKSTY